MKDELKVSGSAKHVMDELVGHGDPLAAMIARLLATGNMDQLSKWAQTEVRAGRDVDVVLTALQQMHNSLMASIIVWAYERRHHTELVKHFAKESKKHFRMAVDEAAKAQRRKSAQ